MKKEKAEELKKQGLIVNYYDLSLKELKNSTELWKKTKKEIKILRNTKKKLKEMLNNKNIERRTEKKIKAEYIKINRKYKDILKIGIDEYIKSELYYYQMIFGETYEVHIYELNKARKRETEKLKNKD